MLQSADLDCPWCWVSNSLLLDCSAGDSELVEDCTVCCRPMLLRIQVDEDGQLLGVEVTREND